MRALVFPLVLASLVFSNTATAQIAQMDGAITIESPDSDRPHVALHLGWHSEPYLAYWTDGYGTHEYTRWSHTPVTRGLCTAPCTGELAGGRHRFVLTDGVGSLYTNSVVVDPGSTLRVHIDRRGAFRTLGDWILGVGMIGSTAYAGWLLVAEGMHNATYPREQFDPFRSRESITGFITAGGVMLVSFVVGLALANLGDTAEVEVIPGGVRF